MSFYFIILKSVISFIIKIVFLLNMACLHYHNFTTFDIYCIPAHEHEKNIRYTNDSKDTQIFLGSLLASLTLHGKRLYIYIQITTHTKIPHLSTL